MVNIHLAKAVHRQRWQFVDDGDQPERIDPPSQSEFSYKVTPVYKRSKFFDAEIPIQIMSDLHLELFFSSPGWRSRRPARLLSF